MSIKKLVLVGFIVVFVCITVYFDDVFVSRFTNSAEAKIQQSKGWIPHWLPKDSKNIYESHNIDTNAIFLMFSIDKNADVDFINEICVLEKARVSIKTNGVVDNLELWLRGAGDDDKNAVYYRCGSGQGVVTYAKKSEILVVMGLLRD